jgi:predicted nucleic acid-binding protein
MNRIARAVAKLLAEHRAVLSAVSVFELFCGARGRGQIGQIAALASRLPPIELTGAAARRAGQQYVRLARRGRLIGNQDLMIAATAAELGIAVLIRNRSHFDHIEGLEILSPEEVLARQER